jgi:1-acyl-sn-glycerol-3-phosphate acyltransferase
MAKNELFQSKSSDRFFRALHTFPVRRDEQDHAAISKAVKLLKEGKVLVIFPEGGRNIDGSKEIQLGVGFLAQLAQVPVVPTLVVGSDKALAPNAKFIKLHPVEVRFGEPIFPQEFSQAHLKRKELSQAITQKVMDKITELKNKNEDSNS